MKKILSILAALTLSTTSTLIVVACETEENKYAKLKDLTDENIIEFFDEVGKEFSYQGDFIFLNDGEVLESNYNDFLEPLNNLLLRTINNKMGEKFKMKETNYIARMFLDVKEAVKIEPMKKYKFNGKIKFINLETNKVIEIKNLTFNFEQTNNIGTSDINEKILNDFLDYNFNYASNNKESLTWARFDASPMVKPIMEGNLEESIEYIKYYMNGKLKDNKIYKEYLFESTVKNIERYDTRYNKDREFAIVEASFKFTDPKVNKVISSKFAMCTFELFL
ncbi:hypothetical protein SSABA_v1c03520 [Spiroplasma sabaudiense Ar-1343]|uniref:Lipoprotein n=1 Tax=Spiroplasma sabaudiense Ar-1343 TaxID=1276257 RepID=W6A9V9_9MOLU|nr:lipoprotein [Spiroplasma sabaudiense]AHI53761.1 hypothetical protein SSABA_v1c03520 [Spiroplasma sabaudiense Ar-1343]